MFCEKCGEKLNENVKFCSKCGFEIGLPNVKPERKMNRKTLLPLLIIGVGVIIAGSIYAGVFDKHFIKSSFEEAFFYRSVGNCEEFSKFMINDQNEWFERCEKEKEYEGTVPLKDYEVLRIDKELFSNRAFLQVELTRDKDPYVVHYEMNKDGFKWLITNEIQ